MTRSLPSLLSVSSVTLWLALGSVLATPAHSAPTAEIAKKCLRYAYVLYPYKRPGASKASNGRQVYFNDCVAKNGDVPEPSRQ
jgi:hypothetical protein